MKTRTIATMAVLFVGLLVFSGIATAFAGRMTEEERDAVKQAVDEGDYDAWKAAVIATLTEEHFNEVVERHAEREEMRESKEAVKEAIENEDYEAFLAAVAELDKVPPHFEDVSEEAFLEIVERHQSGNGNKGIGLGRMKQKMGFNKDKMKGWKQ